MKNRTNDTFDLFGGESEWQASDWTASDDRVRGGKSQSYLDVSDSKIGRFHGMLDIKTLGGAGFASQRTTGDDRQWDLSDYKGIKLNIAKGDKRRYTFILKDSLPDQRADGRDEANISWEIDFNLPPESQPGESLSRSIVVPFASFNPTYRGKPKKDAEPLDLKKIKRASIMMRSFFGTQEGDFSLSIRSIQAVKKIPDPDGGNEKSKVRVLDNRQLEEGRDLQKSAEQEYCVLESKNGLLDLHWLTKVLVAFAVGSCVGYWLMWRC